MLPLLYFNKHVGGSGDEKVLQTLNHVLQCTAQEWQAKVQYTEKIIEKWYK